MQLNAKCYLTLSYAIELLHAVLRSFLGVVGMLYCTIVVAPSAGRFLQVAVLVLAALGMFTLWGAILVDVGAACLVCLNGMRCLCWDIRTGSIWRMPQRRTKSHSKSHHSHSGSCEDSPKTCCNTAHDSCKGNSFGQPTASKTNCCSHA